MMLCRNYSISQALRLYKPPDLATGHGGFCYAFFCPFWGYYNCRELLLRYQDKEGRAPAALLPRGAGGGSPQIIRPRSGLPLAALAPARRARVRARAAEGQRPE